MRLEDLFESPMDGIYNAEDDQRYKSLDDTRKPKVTLRHLNKLRKYREFRKAQDEERDSVVATVYAAPPADDGGMEM